MSALYEKLKNREPAECTIAECLRDSVNLNSARRSLFNCSYYVLFLYKHFLYLFHYILRSVQLAIYYIHHFHTKPQNRLFLSFNWQLTRPTVLVEVKLEFDKHLYFLHIHTYIHTSHTRRIEWFLCNTLRLAYAIIKHTYTYCVLGMSVGINIFRVLDLFAFSLLWT